MAASKRVRLWNQENDLKIIEFTENQKLILGPQENRDIDGKAQPIQTFTGDMAELIANSKTILGWQKKGKIDVVWM